MVLNPITLGLRTMSGAFAVLPQLFCFKILVSLQGMHQQVAIIAISFEKFSKAK